MFTVSMLFTGCETGNWCREPMHDSRPGAHRVLPPRAPPHASAGGQWAAGAGTWSLENPGTGSPITVHDKDTEARAGAVSNPHGLGLSCHLGLLCQVPQIRGSDNTHGLLAALRSWASSLDPGEKPPPGVYVAAWSLRPHKAESTLLSAPEGAPAFGLHLTFITPSGVTDLWPNSRGSGPRPETLGTEVLFRAQQGLTASC